MDVNAMWRWQFPPIGGLSPAWPTLEVTLDEKSGLGIVATVVRSVAAQRPAEKISHFYPVFPSPSDCCIHSRPDLSLAAGRRR